MKSYRLPLLLFQMLLGLIAALGVAVFSLNPPTSDVVSLALYMAFTGILTTLSISLLRRYMIEHWLYSLRWFMALVVVITTIIMFINVFGTAQFMFISYHDMALTSVLLIFGSITAIVCGIFTTNILIDRINQISSAIYDLSQGHLKKRVHVKGQDELAKLAQQINWMAANLHKIESEKQALEQQRRDFVAAISHDLRTPMTAIQAQLEAIADGIVTDQDEVIEYTRNSLTDVKNFKILVDDLFELALLDADYNDLDFVSASLRDLVSDTVGSFLPQTRLRDITIRGQISQNVDPVMMVPNKMQRVLSNLLDNAICHTPNGGTITIGVKRVGEFAQVSIHNTGSFINEKQLPYIFDKFYQADPAREQNPSGARHSGLGLAIARGFVEAHGGTLMVQSHELKGTRFVFRIPRKQA